MITNNLAKHLRDVHINGNWTASNLKEHLSDLSWQQATTQVHNLNTIATLVFHINYYVALQIRVLEGGPLEGNDKESFKTKPIASQQAWEQLVEKTLKDGERLADLIKQMPETKLWEDFTDKKYGSYFRNLQGIIEHTYYHLGQIVLIKKIVTAQG